VKVPAWAYLNVVVYHSYIKSASHFELTLNQDGDRFNVTRAQQFRGTESSRPPNAPSSTVTSASLSTPSNSNPGKSGPNVGAIVGGVVGGVVGLALIAAGLLFYFCRKRPSSTKSNQESAIQTTQHQNPYMGVPPNTFSTSPPPGSPQHQNSYMGVPSNTFSTSPPPGSPVTHYVSATICLIGANWRPCSPVPFWWWFGNQLRPALALRAEYDDYFHGKQRSAPSNHPCIHWLRWRCGIMISGGAWKWVCLDIFFPCQNVHLLSNVIRNLGL